MIVRIRLLGQAPSARTVPRTAFLVDECWPEFCDFVRARRRPQDILGIPFDGERFHLPRYDWDTSGFSRLQTAWRQTLVRSFRVRRLGRYGAARLQAELEASQALARRLSRALAPDVVRLCVSQSLLPFLWRDGHLGGRRFEVLMSRLPLEILHDRLDRAASRNSDRSTLGEYRAPVWIAEAESEALAAAERIFTPHVEYAELFQEKSTLLPWTVPRGQALVHGAAIAFPGPTAARKGAYEVRGLARAFDLEVVLLGAELEGAGFWTGVRTRRAAGNWLDGVTAVVQPALIEAEPRRLLAAVGSSVPVIATHACGLNGFPKVRIVPYGDEAALRNAWLEVRK